MPFQKMNQMNPNLSNLKKISRIVTFLALAMAMLPVILYAQPAGAARGEVSFPTMDADQVSAFFDDLIPRQLTGRHIPGAVVVVVRDGNIRFEGGYGYANLEKQIKVDPETSLFRIAAITKLFTWTAVMQMVEQGKLDLNADVNQYLDFQIPNTFPQPITMKDLMTHTAARYKKITKIALQGIALAMGVAVIVLGTLKTLDINSGPSILGFGLAVLALVNFQE